MHIFKKGDPDYHELLNDNFKGILGLVYPVGSIYTSVKSTNPAGIFGGTWERYAQGQVLVGVDDNDSDFSVGKTGGEKTHKLTESELPPHVHDTGMFKGSNPSGSGGTGGYTYGERAANSGNKRTLATGGDKPHNNLQPYITVYMWVRTK